MLEWGSHHWWESGAGRGGGGVLSSLLLFIELSCLTAFAAAAVMRLERCLRKYSITVLLKAVETSNLLQHNGSVAEEVLRTLSTPFFGYHFHFFLSPGLQCVRVGWQLAEQTQMFFVSSRSEFTFFPPFEVYKLNMLIVFLCVDPHLGEFGCVLYLKCCRLHETLGIMLDEFILYNKATGVFMFWGWFSF